MKSVGTRIDFPSSLNSRSVVSTPFGGIYCASKAALVSLSDALRMELAPFNVKVVIVNPGGTRFAHVNSFH